MTEIFNKNADAFSFLSANIGNLLNQAIKIKNNDKIDYIVISTENGAAYTFIINYKDPEIGPKEIFTEQVKKEEIIRTLIVTLHNCEIALSDLIYPIK